MTDGLWGTRRPTRTSLGRRTPSGKGARRRGLSLGPRDGAPCAGDCRRLAEQARSASPPSAARCPSLSAGSPTTAFRASDPRKAQQAASSTPTTPHRHTHREHRPPLTTVAVPTRLVPGPTHPGKESVAQMGLMLLCCLRRTEVKRSRGRSTTPCPAQATDFQSQKGSPVGTRDASRHFTSGALAGPKGSTSKESGFMAAGKTRPLAGGHSTPGQIPAVFRQRSSPRNASISFHQDSSSGTRCGSPTKPQLLRRRRRDASNKKHMLTQ